MSTTPPLRIELSTTGSVNADGQPELKATFINDGATPLALTFWWNRTLEVRDATGALVTPGPGPVAPCGAAEDWTVLPPGGRHERPDGFACTQPAGESERVGWAYTLSPGTYRARFVYQAPPPHGFVQAEPHPQAFVGTVRSDEIVLTVTQPTPRSWWRRLFGR